MTLQQLAAAIPVNRTSFHRRLKHDELTPHELERIAALLEIPAESVQTSDFMGVPVADILRIDAVSFAAGRLSAIERMGEEIASTARDTVQVLMTGDAASMLARLSRAAAAAQDARAAVAENQKAPARRGRRRSTG